MAKIITKRDDLSINIVAQNKKTRHDYERLEKFEAGIVLAGAEVKALRAKRANLADAFCRFIKGELHLMNAHIAHLETTNKHFVPDTRVPRKLLLHKKELGKLFVKVHKEGLTIVPLMIYFNERNIAKVSIAIAKGKKLHDKRADLKEKTLNREAQQAMKNKSY
ncbi:MAG: ssrA RNA-binding protein [Pseudomonadota bacterium]